MFVLLHAKATKLPAATIDHLYYYSFHVRNKMAAKMTLVLAVILVVLQAAADAKR
jgi:hypothetical protein